MFVHIRLHSEYNNVEPSNILVKIFWVKKLLKSS